VIQRALPSSREAPEQLLERLRAIDPNVRLEYLGDGQWALGVIKPMWQAPDGNYQRRATGALLVGEQRAKTVPHWPTLRMGLLMMQGFGLLQMFEFDGEPTAVILNWFRMADWNWNYRQREFELEMFRKIGNDAGITKARQVLAEWVQGEGPQVFKHAMQHRKSFTMAHKAGLTKPRAR
jgi:hypothetical protein